MKRRAWLSCLVSAALVLGVPAQSPAAIPWMINYQGRLTDTSGNAVAGAVTFTFRLYDAATGGTELWEEQQSLTLASNDNGIFTAILGSVTVMTSVDFNSPMWLSVQVGSDSEMTPRQRLTATGYAMNADQLDSLDSTKFLRTDVDTSTSGKLTITRAGAALVITPSSAPDANTKLIDVQNTSGTTKFSVDYEGDVTVAGDLSVTGTMSGSTSTSGTTNTTWTVDSDNTSGTEPASGAGLVIEGGSGDASILWDATNNELDINQNVNVSGTLNATSVTIGGSSAGDVTAVGDITSGAAFTATDGADGTTLYFEGSTSDSNEIALTSADPGSDFTITLPARTGTVVTTGDTGTVTTTMILDNTLTSDDIGAGAVGSSELASSGVTASSYGSATAVPAITVDEDGRITSASDTTISLGDGAVANNLTISGGTIDDSIIGGTTPAAGTFGGTGNTVTIAGTGVITYAGTAQPKRTIVLTAAGAIVASSSGFADQVRTDGTNFSYYTLNYDQSTDEKAFWQFVVPDSFTASSLTVTIFWTASSGTAAQLVDWEVNTSGLTNDDVFDSALGTATTINDALIATGDLHETSSGTITTGNNGWAAGELATVQVVRDANDATNDTLAADAQLVMVKLEWTASAESD